MYNVYILYSKNIDRFYIGYTSDNMSERLRRHNTNHSGFSGKVGDWEIVYFEEYVFKEEATKREREMKSWKSRKKIEILISSRK
jgi:putative endonuclease